LRLTFYVGVRTEIGSKHLIEISETRVLVDCDPFRGFKNLRLRNRAPLPIKPKSIHAVVLTHAHMNHSGYPPLHVRNGFSENFYCTKAARDLCKVLLTDSEFFSECDAEFANRHSFSKHRPAHPLYTQADTERSPAHFHPLNFDEAMRIADESGAEDSSIAKKTLGARIAHLLRTTLTEKYVLSTSAAE